jgi:hypothetical protein
MSNKQTIANESTEKLFNNLIQRASLAIHYDPNLSPAAKFGLSKEVLGIEKLSNRFDNWSENDAQRLIAHLSNIHQLSPAIMEIVLQGLNQWPLLGPEDIDRQFLENQRKSKQIIV